MNISSLAAIRGGTQQSRYAHVDIIKGWAMLTIIMFHTSTSLFPNITQQLLGNLWNVPVFLIIGGFFLKIETLIIAG